MPEAVASNSIPDRLDAIVTQMGENLQDLDIKQGRLDALLKALHLMIQSSTGFDLCCIAQDEFLALGDTIEMIKTDHVKLFKMAQETGK